jgi:hypothetical protein
MLDWELFRELDDPRCGESKRQPFLAVKEHEERIANVLDKTTMPKPAQIEPLSKVALADAVKRNRELTSGADAGVRVHAFEIEWDEKTDVTVQRFRNWLVAHKQGHDPRSRNEYVTNAAGVPERRMRKPAFVLVRESLARRGRLRYAELLRALAVRRLKEAGYNRGEAEQKLRLTRYALNPRSLPNGTGTNHWNKLPKLAMREIESFAEKTAPAYAPRRKISSP